MTAVKLFVCVALLAVSLKDVRAISKDEAGALREKILPHIKECSKELGISEEILKEAKEKHNSDGVDPCFYSCVFKKAALMTADGKFDADKALKRANEDLKKEEDIKIAENAIKECESVNSEDGDECNRAKSLAKCLKKHKPEFSF